MRRISILVTALAVALGVSTPASAQDEPTQAGAAPAISLSWRKVDLPHGGRGLRVEDIIHAGGRFIAVGGGVKVSPTKIARVWTSKNGNRWQSVTLSGTARRGIMRAIARTPDGFVAVGQGPCVIACSAVWRSPDGTTWQRLANAAVFADSVMRGVVVHDGRLIAVGCRNEGFHCADGRVWASDDGGQTWEQLGDVPGLNFNAVVSVDGQLVGAGDSHGFDEIGQPTYGTSQDGVDWTVHVPDEDDDNGRMLAAGSRGDTALVAGGGHAYSEGSPRFTTGRRGRTGSSRRPGRAGRRRPRPCWT